MKRPNVLFVMTDQQRFDTIAALGNRVIRTPNMDRLVRRGISFNRAYTTCPVCMPARYTIHTGCEPPTTGHFENGMGGPLPGRAPTVAGRCGPYIPQVMRGMGYRTFGVGKFHTAPWDEDLGYDVHLHSEEGYHNEDARRRDSYRAWIEKEHPYYAWIEQIHGERSEMYYMPQMSPLPGHAAVEAWAADRAVELLNVQDSRPFFGFVSFVGPHPPLAPPLPYNRLYDPRLMPKRVRGDIAVDHMDDQLPWMNYMTWSDDVDDVRASVLKARYYGEITFIDECLGRVLDAVESRPDAENTLICFYSDHGDHMGDHHAWQKESFFESSSRVPMLLSWPAELEANVRRNELVCLTDLLAIATGAAGNVEVRDGWDALGVLRGKTPARCRLAGYHGIPGSRYFKMMLVEDQWKYIYMANGEREQLFDLRADPDEVKLALPTRRDVADGMRSAAVEVARHPGCDAALMPGGEDFRTFPFEARPLERLLQMDVSRGLKRYGQL